MSVFRRLVVVGALIAGSTVVSPDNLLANGRFPSSQLVMVSPGSRTIALRVTFGFVLSDDGGQSFRWVCEDVFGYGGGSYDPPFALDANSRLFIGVPDGLNRLSPERCTHDRVAPLERDFLADLDASHDGNTIVGITSSGSDTARNRVWRSTDRGDTWAPMGMGYSNATLFETVEMARSNNLRVYATAVRNTPRRVVFFRSDDGGATLRETSLDAFRVDDAFIAGIDPTNADVVYVRAPLRNDPDAGTPADAGPNFAPTLLLRSTDGGATFSELTRSVGPMTGFAYSDDGQTLWYGGPNSADGLQRSADRGQTWRRLSRAQVTGMRFRDNTLWVGGNWVSDGFALAKSTDNGDTLIPVIRTFCDVLSVPSCPAASDITGLCGARWPLYRSNILGCMPTIADPPPSLDSPGDQDAATGFDASANEPARMQGCRCAVPTHAPRSSRARRWVLLSVAALLSVRVERRSALHRKG